jgi:EAL domain-containing protein (putative c-di-GMP-specific phosphodiesterase class I)
VSPEGGSISMSINITAAHLGNRDLADRIKELITSCELPAGSLAVEITEGQLIGDNKGAKVILDQLRALGVSIHLDDFGTGYSSLAYLHELPLDAIKIDKRFIARLEGGGRDAQVVGTIRELARGLGIPVIAEGVETLEQLALVRALGCEYAQGYLFAKALPPAELSALLRQDPSW